MVVSKNEITTQHGAIPDKTQTRLTNGRLEKQAGCIFGFQ